MTLINCKACGNKISVDAKACPQCGHTRRGFPVKTVVFLGIVGLGVAAVVGAGHKREKDKAAVATSAALEVTASELQDAYDANELAADARFKGQVIQVSGVVGSIERGIGDDPFVVLRTKPFKGVRSHFNDKSVPAALSKGDHVAFRCRGGSYILGSPTLNDCISAQAGATAPSSAESPFDAVVANLEGLNTEMCACRDRDCAVKVAADVTTWSNKEKATEQKFGRPGDAVVRKLTAIGDQVAACAKRALDATPTTAGATNTANAGRGPISHANTDQLSAQAAELDTRISAAIDAAASATTSEEIAAAKANLAKLQSEQKELQAKIAVSRAAAVRAEKASGIRVSDECKRDPNAPACQ